MKIVFLQIVYNAPASSRQGEFHPKPLAEPYVTDTLPLGPIKIFRFLSVYRNISEYFSLDFYPCQIDILRIYQRL
jgi:hypothetical protein